MEKLKIEDLIAIRNQIDFDEKAGKSALEILANAALPVVKTLLSECINDMAKAR